jgi:lipopolysaccharide export system protein LptA
MVAWQRRARLLVLAFGVTVALAVYLGMGQRQRAAAPAPVERTDPQAVAESTSARVQQFSGVRKVVSVRADRTLTYADGSSRVIGVELTVPGQDGRVFMVSAPEGRVSGDGAARDIYELWGGITLRDNQGFALETERGVFGEHDLTVRAAGPVSFTKGRLRGTGVGMAYDQQFDVLRINERARVDVSGNERAAGMLFTAGSAVLDRQQDRLFLDGTVHAERGSEILDADRATAHLTAAEDVLTFIELRGNSRVAGVEAVQSMQARDIDLDYTDDGVRLERAALTGSAAVGLPEDGGSAAQDFSGERLDVAMNARGGVATVAGAGAVRMTLRASRDMPARAVGAESLSATAGEDGVLTSADFTTNVVYEEKGAAGAAGRTARAQALALQMANGEIANAGFRGGTTFEEGDLRASAPEAAYAPGAGTLQLRGTGSRGGPEMSDTRLWVSAAVIDIVLEHRQVTAQGRVKTTLRATEAGARTPEDRSRQATRSRLPGLLSQKEIVNVTASRLAYDGDKGTAVYAGSAWLWQGETEIRSDTIDINQQTGDLLASGSAHSVLQFDGKPSNGEADTIRYTDETRIITYTPHPRSGAAGVAAATARLRGPQGDLEGGRIDVHLAEGGGRIDRVEARNGVSAEVDMRTIVGNQLTYRTEGEQYEVRGTPGRRAEMTERDGACRREFTGNLLTFSRSADTMRVDGQSLQRTQTKSTCGPASR